LVNRCLLKHQGLKKPSNSSMCCARFKHAIETGELILAGRTSESGDKTFGIAIFEAKDEPAARAFMESDPAVVARLMTAELHPFAVALQRKNP
jgi:uncharacterized protein YciI